MKPKQLLAERTQIAIAASAVAMTLMIGVGVAFAQTTNPPLASGPYALLTEIQAIGKHLDTISATVTTAAACTFTSNTCKTPTAIQTTNGQTNTAGQTQDIASLQQPTQPQGFTWVDGKTGKIYFGYPPADYRYDPIGGTWFTSTEPYWAAHIDNQPPQTDTTCGPSCQYCHKYCQFQADLCGAGGTCTQEAASCQNACPTT